MHRVIDLSHKIQEGMQIYPGDPAPSIGRGLVHESDYCHVDRLNLGSHTGTHIDAPYHFLADGARIDEYEADRFVGKGVIVDATRKKAGESITSDDLVSSAQKIEQGDFVLFRTGWDRYFGTEMYLDHPYLSADLAETLVSMGAALVGVDFLNVDPTRQEIFPVHEILLSKDIFIVENLVNLGDVADDTAWFSFLPLKVSSDGSPVRAIAVI